MDESKAKKTIAKFPSLLGYSVEANLKPKLQWLKDLGMSDSQVAKAIAMKPSLLGCSVEDNLKPKLQWLKDRAWTSRRPRRRSPSSHRFLVTASRPI
mmetsp:Transcript_2149/g.6334  ORF Transcript_2149/g.6334 Transcript_2149/m.6334 type:complete len:97 (-) Transcript_2149:92-382(-)